MVLTIQIPGEKPCHSEVSHRSMRVRWADPVVDEVKVKLKLTIDLT